MLFSYASAARAIFLNDTTSALVRLLSPFLINASIFFIVALYSFAVVIFCLFLRIRGNDLQIVPRRKISQRKKSNFLLIAIRRQHVCQGDSHFQVADLLS